MNNHFEEIRNSFLKTRMDKPPPEPIRLNHCSCKPKLLIS